MWSAFEHSRDARLPPRLLEACFYHLQPELGIVDPESFFFQKATLKIEPLAPKVRSQTALRVDPLVGSRFVPGKVLAYGGTPWTATGPRPADRSEFLKIAGVFGACEREGRGQASAVGRTLCQ